MQSKNQTKQNKNNHHDREEPSKKILKYLVASISFTKNFLHGLFNILSNPYTLRRVSEVTLNFIEKNNKNKISSKFLKISVCF